MLPGLDLSDLDDLDFALDTEPTDVELDSILDDDLWMLFLGEDDDEIPLEIDLTVDDEWEFDIGGEG